MGKNTTPYPNWRLMDGTNIYGPLRSPSQGAGGAVAVLDLGGRKWYFGHPGGPLNETQLAELREWAAIVTAKMA